MNTKRRRALTGLITGLIVFGLALAGCTPAKAPVPTPIAVPPTARPLLTPTAAAPTATPPPLPTLSLDETSAQPFMISDFGAVHAPVTGDPNKALIFGNIPISKPAADLAPELAPFLGRWEGYDTSGPVKNDQKIVTVIQSLTARDGQGFG